MAAINRETWDKLRAWADSERSDPFAFARALAHTRNGLAGIGFDADGRELIDGRYSARPEMERRTYQIDGREVEYYVTVHRDRRRP